MTRRLTLLFLLSLPVWAQEKAPPPVEEQEPPEEDEALIPKEYAFNPIQAQKELNIGNFYFKKGSWRAAAMRYDEATKWNPGYPEAWLRLGEAREKMGDREGMASAFKQFLEVAPEHKRAAEVRKKLASLPAAKKAAN